MRVRFAPSPTGALHIGGVRTALYNYLLAKKNGGDFILRIEDTDRTRYVEGAENYIIEALEWLGLEFDESPAKGGAYAPYRQSERKEQGHYIKYAEELIESGNAYYAFDTAEELTQQRAEAEAQGQKFKYDSSSRLKLKNSLTLEASDWQKRIAEGEDYVIRLMIPDEGIVTFKDTVRGTVSFDCSELDDKVLLKGDGMPTYHLANVVDDHLMKITHIIRGEEWLPSVPTHVLLYRYLGWESTRPVFAHLPLILKPEPAAYINKRTVVAFTERFASEFVAKNEDWANQKDKVQKQIQPLLQDIKSIASRLKINEKKDSKLQKAVKTFLRNTMNGKLSKRDGDRLGMPVFPLDWKGTATKPEHFRGFREWGFLPEAVLNLLALLGWNDGTEQEIYSLEELVKAFDMERVSSAGARFNFEKAKWFNKQYLAGIDNTKLAKLVLPALAANDLDIENKKLEQVCELLKPRINFVADFVGQSRYFFQDLDLEQVANKHQKNLKKKVLNKWSAERVTEINSLVATIQNTIPFTFAALEEAIEPLIADKKGEILPIFRLALSGEMGGPGVYEIMEVLGQPKTVNRLIDFVEFCNQKHQQEAV